MKSLIKNIIKLTGYNTLLVFAAHEVYAFYLIQVRGISIFMIKEDNLFIRNIETIITVFGVAFAVYLLFLFLKSLSFDNNKTEGKT